MCRWRAFLPGLLLTGLVACGGAVTTSPQVLTEATAPATPRGSATPRASASPAAASSSTTAAAAPTVTRLPGAPPTTIATRTVASAATPVPQPNGTIPRGWKVYRGPIEIPFVIAYPPDWTVDDSYFPDQYIVFINSPSGADSVEIEFAANQSGSNIDVLRDEFFNKKSAFCDKKGIENTSHRQMVAPQATVVAHRAAITPSVRVVATFLCQPGRQEPSHWNDNRQEEYQLG